MSYIIHLIGLTPALLVILAFALPLISLIVKNRRVWEVYGVTGSLIGLLLASLTFYYTYFVQSPIVYKFGAWPPPIGIVYEIDRFNSLLGLVVAGVMFFVALYSVEYLEREHGVEWYFTLFLGMEAGMLGVLYTGDVFNLFVMLEVTSVTAYGLVAFYRSRKESIEAALKYAIIGSTATTVYFIALALIYGSYGTLNMAQISLKTASPIDYFFTILYGNRLVGEAIYYPGLAVAGAAAIALAIWAFSVKAALFPNHFWLPDAHPAAPSPVSAVLSGLLVKVGVYAIARFTFTLFHAATPDIIVSNAIKDALQALLVILLVLGAASALVAGFMMIVQTDIKRLIAYSTIMHIGYIAMGLGLASYIGLQAAIYHAINHAVAKALLFLAAGVFIHVVGTRSIDEISGVGRVMPVTTLSFVIAALSLAGIPPFNGFVSKALLYIGFIDAGLAPLTIIVVLSSALAFMAYAKIIYGVWLKAPVKDISRLRDPSWLMKAPLMVLSITCILLGILSPYILDHVVNPAVTDLAYNARNYIVAALNELQQILLGG